MGLFSRGKTQVVSKFGIEAKFTNAEGMSENALRWETLARQITDPLAQDWFSDLEPISVLRAIEPRTVNEGLFQMITPFSAKEEPNDENVNKVIPELIREQSEFGEPLLIKDTYLGKQTMLALERAGITWNYEGDNGSTEGILNETKAVAMWLSAFGLPVVQSFEIFSRNGEEFCYWSAPQLIATRAFEHIYTVDLADEEDGSNSFIALSSGDPESDNLDLTFGEWSTHIYVPILAQSLLYLAETPFPSSMLNLPRHLAFPDLDIQKLPIPRLRIRRNEFVFGAIDNGFKNSRPESDGSHFPMVIDFGWEFNCTETDDILVILNNITNGLVNISTYLEDGFLNHCDSKSSFSWDWALFSACIFNSSYVEGESHFGFSYWLPATFAGAVANTSRVLHTKLDQASGDDRIILAEELALDGVGYFAVCGINALVFNHLRNIEGDKWFCYEFLDSAVRLDMLNESTNALSIWGIIKFENGELAEAKQKFEAALDRQDRYAEAEASHYLSLIFAQENNLELSERFKQRCQAAGGYKPSN
jgi:hypothetical protein